MTVTTEPKFDKETEKAMVTGGYGREWKRITTHFYRRDPADDLYFGASGEGGNHGNNDEMKLKEITWLFIDDNILNLKFVRSFTLHSIADC